jgi:hypothetical protein
MAALALPDSPAPTTKVARNSDRCVANGRRLFGPFQEIQGISRMDSVWREALSSPVAGMAPRFPPPRHHG